MQEKCFLFNKKHLNEKHLKYKKWTSNIKHKLYMFDIIV